MASANYEAIMSKLLASGWTPADGIPEELIAASNADNPGSVEVGGPYPEGSPENPMELSTMEVRATAPQAETNPGGVVPGLDDSVGVFAGMDDEDADMYAGMGELKQQREYADAMRNTDDAEGRYVNQGRTFVAASPLEHLVVGAKRMKGKKDSNKIGGKQTKGRRSLIDLLRNKDEEVDTETIMDGPNGSTGFFDIEEEETGLA